MTTIKENTGRTSGTRVERSDQPGARVARIGERVTVSLRPGKIHQVTRSDRFGGKIASWGPRGLSLLHTRSQQVVYVLNEDIEVVHSQDR